MRCLVWMFCFAAVVGLHIVRAQDSIRRPLQVSGFVAPVVGVSLGTAITFAPALQQVNPEVREAMQRWRHNSVLEGMAIRVDDVLQYAPAASVLLLKWVGVPTQQSYSDLLERTLMTYGLVCISTMTVKCWVQEPRPNNEWITNSFYSGHTAIAFSGAELLRLSYRDATPWIGIGAYAVCSLTGLLRIYNDRHWLGDVLVGAGVGILSAQVSYRLCHYLQRSQVQPAALSLGTSRYAL